MRTLIVALLLTQLLAGCSVSESHKSEDKSYQYTVNGCDTTRISYGSAEDLCAKLKDDAVNHNCAASARYERFKQDCSGQSWN